MRKIFLCSLVFLVLLLASCSTQTPPPAPPVVTVYSSPFTQTWLTDLYTCAGTSATIRLSDAASASAADIRLQLGEPDLVTGFAYQLDEEELLIITNRTSPVQNLTLEQAQALFMGLGDPAAQVWVYAAEAEGQRVFDQFVMNGRSVVSSARVAATPQQMSDVLVNEANAVGILPRHWKAGDVREVYSVARVPVLALTPNEPQGVLKELIACLQQ